ncbi:MAG TPA: bacteriohemerythrin [Nitrospinota bacterium]|nr:bacteriohemerythrin [Nitrospinota bacterium]|tara:strand:+ start:61 stop:468 length:408 start_codon:yes stop_codon:yes gene_type:complete
MPLFNWSEKFMLGIPEIDEQHKQIVDLINNLNNLKNKTVETEYLGKIIEALISYTRTHLAYEERLLRQHNYPEFAPHKSEHDKLVKEATDLQTKFFTGVTDLSTDIAILLNDWLAEHILVVDKKYVPYLKNKGID